MSARASKKRSLPTTKEATALKLIAQGGGLVITYLHGRAEFSTAGGLRIEKEIAERLIRLGWVIGDRGDALFGCAPQRYRIPPVVGSGAAS